MKRGCRLLVLLVVFCFVASSCGRKERFARDILLELCETAGDLPTGEIYHAAAEEGESGYLSSEMIESLYGEEGKGIFEETLKDYAVYLSSFAVPCEIAVLHTYSATDAHRVAAMCFSRADEIQVALHRTEWERMGESIEVVVRGRWVVMIVTEANEEVKAQALRQIR